MDVHKSQWRKPLLCREYYFFATENSRYFKLCSKTKGCSKKTNNAYLHLLQAQVDLRSTLCNWLLNRKFENENSKSLKRADKCVQSETVVPLSPQNENKVKSNVSPLPATVTAITENGGIITSLGSSLKIRIIIEIYGKGLELTDACNTTRVGQL